MRLMPTGTSRISELVRDDLTRAVCPVVHWICFVTRRRVILRPRVHSLRRRRYGTESVQHEDTFDFDAETLRKAGYADSATRWIRVRKVFAHDGVELW